MNGVPKNIVWGIFAIPLLLVVIILAALVLSRVPGASAAEIVEAPRSAAPMSDLTKSFSKRQFVINDGIDKRVLTYYWLSPRSARAKGEKFPLVVVLHDIKGKAYAAEQLASGKMPDDFPAFVLVPQSPGGKEWAMPESYPDNPAYLYDPQRESLPDVIALISKLVDQEPIDSRRIYIIGCEDGGAGVYGALSRYSDLFAAGVVIGAKWSVDDVPNLTAVPLVIEQGAVDDVAPVEVARLMAQQIGENGGTVSFQEFPRLGHECSNPNFYQREMWDALFRQKQAADVQ
jgi:predicted peptidase